MIEVTRASDWLRDTLLADATLNAAVGGRVYDGPRQETALPFVVIAHLGGHDVMGVGAARIMADLVFAVKVVGRGHSWSDLEAAADRIDAALHGKQGTTPDGRVLSCTRHTALALVETDQGIEYRHLGGTFRVLAQPLS